MYIDKLLEICTSLDLGALGDVTTLSENSVDLGAAKDLSKGRPLYAVVTIEEAFDGTCNFQVITDSVATLADTPTVHSTTGALASASLTLNREPIVIPIGNPLSVSEQFLGMQFTCAGSTTTGIVSAHIGFETP